MRLHLHLIFVPLAAAGCAFFLSGMGARAQAPAGLTPYTIGAPSGDETEVLCEINRARSNPPTEGPRLVDGINAAFPNGDSGIDLNLLLSQFQGYPARAPLAFNADLNASAAAHVADMMATNIVQHDSSDGTSWATRIESFGYATPFNENIAGAVDDVGSYTPWQTEGSYEIDTNTPGYGHRLAVLEPYTIGRVEVGVSVSARDIWSTEDFGANPTPTLLTGVVFTDDAGTGFYASGEGLGGYTVTAPGASSHYAVTVTSGAYTLPLDLLAYEAGATPTVQVVFTDAAGHATTQAVTMAHRVEADQPTWTYYDAAGNVRYDNAEADLVEPGSVGGGAPTPTPTPTPAPAPTPAMPQVTIAPVDGSMQFVLTRTGDTSLPLTVSYVVKGSAVAGDDFVPLSGTKKIKAGKSTAKISVQMLPGARGTVKLKISAGGNAYNAPAPAQAKVRLGGG